MINIQKKENCCGCTSCESICSHDAIIMYKDQFGFVYPKIDLNKCVDCGLCEKVCPILNANDKHEPTESYVATAKDLNEQLTSTSGGIATVISRYIIKNLHGVVYGCTGIEAKHVKHIRVEKEEYLYLLKGSKYVQSDISGIYPKVKVDLNNAKVVLFIGTPCQNAGLKKFLRKEYVNLYCIDFICHGVPSQQMLNDATEELGYYSKQQQVVFRYKKNHKSFYCLRLIENNKILYSNNYGKDIYISAFLNGLNYRESCYACKFATPQRVSDITLGDFWDKKKEYTHIDNHKNGLSQININTDKGRKIFDFIKTNVTYSDVCFDKLLAHSEQLHEPMPRHKKTEVFYNLYKPKQFIAAVKVSLSDFFSYYKRNVYMSYIYRIPGTYKLVQKFKKIIKK